MKNFQACPQKMVTEDPYETENCYVITLRDSMEGPKLILPKNPTEKCSWAPKIAQILQKMSKIGHFGPFWTQKWAVGPKLSILTNFFLHPPSSNNN